MSHLVKALWDWFVNMGYKNKIWLIYSSYLTFVQYSISLYEDNCMNQPPRSTDVHTHVFLGSCSPTLSRTWKEKSQKIHQHLFQNVKIHNLHNHFYWHNNFSLFWLHILHLVFHDKNGIWFVWFRFHGSIIIGGQHFTSSTGYVQLASLKTHTHISLCFSGRQSQLFSSVLWYTLKCLNNYWMKCHSTEFDTDSHGQSCSMTFPLAPPEIVIFPVFM